ncbi:MAG: hypothetical protein CVV64_04720 [Candidatus Wallbacteria bacterium HGW-Wallbacteria-1]|jgi:CRP-like cAMP-binding protein|uniref:Cyclic nucleotide-binding domain-containing protein n=1 Tax=Candidatus Wallbacteria bacterium HGW-Wallbacteria-1 TaxID=2013854 RepID=A0A2N1PRW7_9BACT|nr:MAG: hypothetical protein CVV64_04720 [Candidatus Wallbacteria bacterium HGW-Wallbacteria-1]
MIRMNILEETPLLNTLSNGEIEKFSTYLQPTSLADGEILFREGDTGNYMCVVANGRVGIAKSGRGDELKIMWELCEGKVFGELALFDGQPRSGTALSLGESEVYLFNRNDFVRLSDEKPEIALKLAFNVVKILSGNLRNTTTRFIKAADALQAKTRR